MYEAIIPQHPQERAFGFPLRYPTPSLKVLPANQPSLASECLRGQQTREGGGREKTQKLGSTFSSPQTLGAQERPFLGIADGLHGGR